MEQGKIGKVRMPEALRRSTVSISTLRRWWENDRMPRPHKIGGPGTKCIG